MLQPVFVIIFVQHTNFITLVPRFCSEWSDPTDCISNQDFGKGEEFRVRKCWYLEADADPLYKPTWEVLSYFFYFNIENS